MSFDTLEVAIILINIIPNIYLYYALLLKRPDTSIAINPICFSPKITIYDVSFKKKIFHIFQIKCENANFKYISTMKKKMKNLTLNLLSTENVHFYLVI